MPISVRFLPDSILGLRQEKIFRNLYQKLNPHQVARAYGGVHSTGFAEPEFAGKYMDISAAYARNLGDKEALERAAVVVRSILAGQRADGYLGGYAPGEEAASFSVWNQAFTLIGLVAYYETTGDKAALAAAEKCLSYVQQNACREGADPFLHAWNYGSEHLVILLPAARLYALTHKESFGDFCRFILDTCRQSPMHNIFAKEGVAQFGSPKGIETLAFLLGVVAWGEVTGDSACIEAADYFWQDMADNYMLPTGSGTIGELWTYSRNAPALLPWGIHPNENCVTVGWMELSLMLYDHYLDGKYFDQVETSLYNHLLGSLAPDGSDFAYYQGNFGRKSIRTSEGMYACCRFRGLSMFAHLPECAIFQKGNTLAFPLYASYDAETEVEGKKLALSMRTDYPRSGHIHLHLFAEEAQKTGLLLRLPGWCPSFTLKINDRQLAPRVHKGHIHLEEGLSQGDTDIELVLELPLRQDYAQVDELPCVLTRRGPLVLALDSHYGTPTFSTTLNPEAALIPAEECGYMPMLRMETEGTVRGDKRKLFLVDYASAGMQNPEKDRFRVWIPVNGADLEGIY